MTTRLRLLAVSGGLTTLAALAYACGSDSGGLVEEGPPDVTAADTFTPAADAPSGTDAPSGDAGRDGARDGGGDGNAADAREAGLPLVKINEVFVDKNLSGDAVEWIELWAPQGTSLAGLRLRLIYAGDAGVKYEVDVSQDGGAMAGNYWVVGGILATGGTADQEYSIAVWGLSDVGAIQLVKFDNGNRILLDTVGYGGVVPPLPQPPTATSEGNPFNYGGNAIRSFGRRVDDAGLPVDTQNNAADFCDMSRSFRGQNGQCQ
jgi:hypothetical protein